GKLALVGNAAQAKAAFEKALPVLGLDGKQFEQQMLPFTDTVLAFEIFANHPTVRYDLVLPPEAELRHSSGTVDAKTRQVEHTQLLTPRPVSRMFFALWSVPDTAWQTKHLGGVVLRGEALETYITWESALDDAQAKVWRQAIERLDPKQDLPKQLAAIHTGPVPVDEEVAPEEGAKLLISALKRPKKMVDPLDP
ncbi:hypothetical protein HQ576_04495, partial [bacterium]|nr:hypothetical protein [bacterium]